MNRCDNLAELSSGLLTAACCSASRSLGLSRALFCSRACSSRSSCNRVPCRITPSSDSAGLRSSVPSAGSFPASAPSEEGVWSDASCPASAPFKADFPASVRFGSGFAEFVGFDAGFPPSVPSATAFLPSVTDGAGFWTSAPSERDAPTSELIALSCAKSDEPAPATCFAVPFEGSAVGFGC